MVISGMKWPSPASKWKHERPLRSARPAPRRGAKSGRRSTARPRHLWPVTRMERTLASTSGLAARASRRVERRDHGTLSAPRSRLVHLHTRRHVEQRARFAGLLDDPQRGKSVLSPRECVRQKRSYGCGGSPSSSAKSRSGRRTRTSFPGVFAQVDGTPACRPMRRTMSSTESGVQPSAGVRARAG
jgi:hypothetical protein